MATFQKYSTCSAESVGATRRAIGASVVPCRSAKSCHTVALLVALLALGRMSMGSDMVSATKAGACGAALVHLHILTIQQQPCVIETTFTPHRSKPGGVAPAVSMTRCQAHPPIPFQALHLRHQAVWERWALPQRCNYLCHLTCASENTHLWKQTERRLHVSGRTV